MSQNILGLGAAAVGMLVVQVLLTRNLGASDFGVVTVLSQAAFVASFGTRAGMDMAVLRAVAIEAGEGRYGRIRGRVTRAVYIAAIVSTVTSVAAVAFKSSLLEVFSISATNYAAALPAAALGLPFIAVTNVYLAATRGLKIMRYTLYVFWAGQNVMWVILTLLLWRFSVSAASSTLAYSLSWVWAAGAAAYLWRRTSRHWELEGMEPGWLTRLLRYAGPRTPAALFAQLLFWVDLFVVARFVSNAQVGIYSAALRAAQVMMLFLAAVNLMFSPYVADLHNRGQTDHLDRLYKTLTRWIAAATLPVFLLIATGPSSVLSIFGTAFSGGETALLILLAGQVANIATGSAGFILVMTGRTGSDFLIYAASIALNIVVTLWLGARYGIEGAATASAATFLFSNVARLLLVRKFIGIQPYDANYSRLVLPAGACAAAMWTVHAAVEAAPLLDLVLTAVIGGLVYALAYGAIGLTPGERRGAAALLARLRPAERG
ncbi:MAG: polysaccharide biosynthesis C-terminal domain-containing protein [Actinomycetota bacterium]|nr:polysaccharide biosynthesis C-terminal domain-containing protein [Actinomycetota bacterium]